MVGRTVGAMAPPLYQSKERAMTTKQMVALATVAVALMVSTAVAAAKPDGLSTARAATAGYHNIDALPDGYGEFRDAQGIACIDKPGEGGMGIHYANPDLVTDGAVDASTPEALVYEPKRNGRLRLVAAEYIVFQADWDANHSSPPSLFGQEFELIPGAPDNRYGLPAFYELHAWLWKHNPSGMFNDWNPRVSCAAA
jgi:hypothetical protein